MPANYYELGNNQFNAAFTDITSGLSRWRLWIALAFEDIRLRFKRTYIGILWTTVSFALFVAVKVLIFSPFTQADSAYFTNYVAIGFFAWMFISSLITDGCNVFINSERWMKGGRLPLTLFVNVSMTRSVVLAFFNFIVVVGLMAIYHVTPTVTALWSFVAFLLFIINGFSLHFILGILCSRFRDMSHLIQAIMRVMFFLTPIFWLPEQMGDLWKYLSYNPFAHFLISFRDPLLSGTVPWDSFAVVLSFTVSLVLIAFALLAFARRRIIFWL